MVDSRGAFDPLSASEAGVDLRRLLWVRADHRIDRAFKAADMIVSAFGANRQLIVSSWSGATGDHFGFASVAGISDVAEVPSSGSSMRPD